MALGDDFARAIAAKDADALLELLQPDLDFRAMTPGRFWESRSAAEVVEGFVFGRWFGPADRIDALEAVECDAFANRQRVGYRLRVTRDGMPHIVEQQAYFSTDGDRISWLRIMCAGYCPVAAEPAA
jgi:hypothetical protein